MFSNSSSSILSTVSWIFFSLLLFTCVWVFYNSVTYQPASILPHRYEIHFVVDSLQTDVGMHPAAKQDLDSLKILLQGIKKMKSDAVVSALADIKEESNKLIASTTAWLSFWLAILALIGGVMPTLLSWKREREYKEEFEKQKSQSQVSLDRMKADLQCKFTAYNQEFFDLKERYNAAFDDANLLEKQLQLTSLTTSFIAAMDNRLIDDNSNRDKLRSTLLRAVSLHLGEVIELILKDKFTLNRRNLLCGVLVQVHSLLLVIRPGLLQKHKVKQVEKSLHILQDTIRMVTEDCSTKYEVENHLRQLLSEVDDIPYLF